MRASGPRGREMDWREQLSEAAVVVVEVGGTRTGQCLPRDRPGIHNEPDNHDARPRPRAHGQNRRPPQVTGHLVCPF